MKEPYGGDLRDLCRFDKRFYITEPVYHKGDAELIFTPRSGGRERVVYVWEGHYYSTDKLPDALEAAVDFGYGICYALEEDRYGWDVYLPPYEKTGAYRVGINKDSTQLAGARHVYSGYALLMAYVHLLSNR